MDRRHFLAATPALLAGRAAAADDPDRAWLRSCLRTRQQVEDFVSPDQSPERRARNLGWVFDPDLGWTLTDSVRSDGVGGSKTFYHYESDGARRVINSAGRPCRVHTFGDSYTHCDQVSDGETWQEYLAAHLQEPVRNYGVGGYSVYQAYRRMLRVEKQHPAEYVILNVYDDDHYRNLDAWRTIRFAQKSACGFTLPHLRVDVAKGTCEEVPNLLRRPEDVYKLCDEGYVTTAFRDDPVLRMVLAVSDKGARAAELAEPVAVGFGIPRERVSDGPAADRVTRAHTAAALFATRTVVGWAADFCAKEGKKFLLVLSFNRHNAAAALEGKPPFDREFLDWLKGQPYPVIDVRDVFRAAYQGSRLDPRAFLAPYYNGHHSPLGNFATAWAIKDKLVTLMNPRPLPYR